MIKGKAKKSKSNPDKGERDALKELSERTNVLITNADKGGAVVIYETTDYMNEANRQLTHNKLINDAIDRFKQEQLIPIETAKILKIKRPKISYATKNT